MLWTAKDVFLTTGFERATMDAIASRAGTTKRTLYAHFAGKEALFLAVVDLVQDLLSGKLGRPESYADDPVEASDEAERLLIVKTLASTNNNKTRAAEILGISLKTLHNKLKEYSHIRLRGKAPQESAPER